MSEFTLDTSGEVRGASLFEQPDGNWRSHWVWSDLDAFTQGYVEAAFAEWANEQEPGWVGPMAIGFSDLAAETLAAILKDCDQVRPRDDLRRDVPRSADNGARVWDQRQRGVLREEGFPPLTIAIGDDGKIRLDPTP